MELKLEDIRYTPVQSITEIGSCIDLRLTDYNGEHHYLSVTKEYAKLFAEALLERCKDK